MVLPGLGCHIGHQLIYFLCEIQIKPTYYSQSGRSSYFAGNVQSKEDDHHNRQISDSLKGTRHVTCEMSGVVQEVGMGVSQFVKGQSVVLMPLQPEYEFQDCEHGKRQRVIENGFMNSKGMLYHSPNHQQTLTLPLCSYILCSIIISLPTSGIGLLTKRQISRSTCNSQPCFTTYIPIPIFGQRPYRLLQLYLIVSCPTTIFAQRIANHRCRTKSYIEKTRGPIWCHACPRPRRYRYLRICAPTYGRHGRGHRLSNLRSMRLRTDQRHCL